LDRLGEKIFAFVHNGRVRERFHASTTFRQKTELQHHRGSSVEIPNPPTVFATPKLDMLATKYSTGPLRSRDLRLRAQRSMTQILLRSMMDKKKYYCIRMRMWWQFSREEDGMATIK